MTTNFELCGQCCAVLSVWGIVQLGITGLLYLAEPVILFEEAAPEAFQQFNSYEEFKNLTREGFRSVAMNCFLAAGLYVVTLFLSFSAIKKARRAEARALLDAERDDVELKPKSRHQYSMDMSDPLPKKASLFRSV